MPSIKVLKGAFRGTLIGLVVLFLLSGCGKPQPPDVGTPTPLPTLDSMQPTSDPNEAFK